MLADSRLRIWHSPYQLRPRRKLGDHATPGPRHGALLRVEYPGWGFGYADCHPWEERGDEPLAAQLAGLTRGRLTPLTRNALRFSRLDAEARSRGRSLFEGLSVPASHFLLTDISEESVETACQALAAGFDRIKLKLGREWRKILPLLKVLLATPGARFRIDLNSCLHRDELSELLAALRDFRTKIEFLEDPLPWRSAPGWENPPDDWAFALDREVSEILADFARASDFPAVLVIKPAINDWKALAERGAAWKKRLVFTSYLDHPLGQLSAAYAAARAARARPEALDVCGLLSHSAYEMNPFSESLHCQGPRLEPDRGPGFGMGELLANRTSWKPLEGH